MHEFLAAVRHWVDGLLVAGIGVTFVSYQQAAFTATCFAGVVTGIVGIVKLYDRFKYGYRGKE